MEKVMNKKRFGSRFIAFFVMLAMIMSMCVPVAWAAGASNGSVRFRSNTTNEEINETETGVRFDIYATITYSSAAGEQSDLKMYLGIDDLSKIKFEEEDNSGTPFDTVGDSFTRNGYTYTLQYDAEKGYYIQIIGTVGGAIQQHVVSASFVNGTALDGDTLTITLYEGGEEVKPPSTDAEASRTITARADLEWSNLKSVEPSNITLNRGATKLSDNTGNIEELTYTIIETANANIKDGKYVAPTTSTLNNGEAILQTYTATDTFKLPDGMYIAVEEGQTAEDAVKAAFDFSALPAGYTINVTASDSKVTEFTVTWTETNSDSSKAMESKSYDITLKTDNVSVNMESYAGGAINNSVVTDYYYNTSKGLSEKKTTQESAASTFAAIDGSGMGGVTKSLSSIVGDKAADYVNYDGTISGYVVEGDTITYAISIYNNSDGEKTYDVTDFLGDAQLTLESCTLNGEALETTTDDSGNVSFDVKVAGKSTAVVYITGKVGATTENTTIVNKAKVTLGEAVVEVESPSMPHQPTVPEIYIQKTADIAYYTNDSTFNYYITVSNNGTAGAENIKIEDILPDGIELNGTATATSGIATVTNKTISDTVTLGVGESVKITIPVKIDATAAADLTTITNTASESYSNKSSSATITKNTASVSGLSVTKQADKTIVSEGDTVTYTVTVTNPNGSGDLKGANFTVTDILPDGFTYVSSTAATVLEGKQNWEGAYLEEGGSVTVDAIIDPTKPTFTFTNVTIKNNNSITFTITCTVGEVVSGATITNTVRISDDKGNTGNSGSSNVTASGTASDSTIMVDKQIFDSNGNEITDGAVVAGESIEFRVTITNKGTSKLTNFTVKDLLVGNYILTNNWLPAASVKVYSITQGSSLGNLTNGLLFGGDAFYIQTTGSTMHFNNSDSNDYAYTEAYQNEPGICILPEGAVTLSYTVTTASSFTTGSNSITATNLADDSSSSDTVSYSASAVEESPDLEEPQVSNAQLSITKSVENEVLTTDQLTARNKYTVTVTNTSEEDYVTTDAVFIDYIPGNMALSILENATYIAQSQYNYTVSDGLVVPVRITGDSNKEYITQDLKSNSYSNLDNYIAVDSITMTGGSLDVEVSSYAWKTLANNNPTLNMINANGGYESANVDQANYKIEGSTLTVDFGTLTIPSGQSLTFTYYLIPTDEEVTSITNAVSDGTFEDREYKNEAAFSGTTSFLNSEGETVNKIIDVETVSLTMPKIHPGISKEYSGHFANSSSTDVLGPSTSVKVGEYLVWTVKVYNGATAGGLTMDDYTVKEVYPEGYSFVEGSVGGYVPSIKKYDAYGTEMTVSGLNYVNPESGVFNFSGDAYDLAPGQHLEFTVLTDGDDALNNGIYTNKVVLTPNETIYDDAIVSGVKEGTGISASVSLPLYTISTTSSKTVTSADGTRSASSTSDALENRIKVSMGETITYKLEVKNNDPANILEDFAVIDRLPYSEDKGVISTDSRGSVFPVKYAGNPRATITLKPDSDTPEVIELDSNYLDVKFASDATSSFASTDLDWLSSSTARAGITRVSWLDEADITDSTNLVKFTLKNLENLGRTEFVQSIDIDGVTYTKYGVPANAKIAIEFDAKVPEFVQNVGEGNIAWNSFGYYFNSPTEENLIAEPAKVGVWVEDENYGGSILVRKIYKTNLPSKVRTFYFALYEGEYNAETNNKPLDIANITMTGSENGAQATTYFTNIDFDRSKNNAYYIYESDANGVPLEAYEMEEGSYTATKPNSGVDSTETTQTKANYKSKTAIGADGLRIVMDNTAQNTSAEDKPNWDQYYNEVAHYNSKYLVWHKDLSASKTTNSAIFTNTYIASAKYEMMGPFYADVPTSATDGATEKMTSTRPTKFTTGEITEVEKSTERNMAYGSGPYATTNQYGGEQKHTIATGFLARLTGEGNYTIEQVQWTVTTSDATARSAEGNPGVYVRLRTETASTSADSGVETVMYLNDFDVYEENTDEGLELGTVGGFDDVTEDEDFLSDYTVEERAAMIAEGLGIDPDNILYDDFGQPYVVLDEELEAEAFALSESTETTTPVTTDISEAWYDENSAKYITPATDFTDYNSTTGYIIYKLVDNAPQYTMTFNDNIPHITLTDGAQAYVGLVIDQLYDQKATAKLKLSDEPLYDDTMIVATGKANMANYTLVESPRQQGNFSVSVLYKLSAGNVTTFEDLLASDGSTQKYTSTIYNKTNTARITANSSKSVSVQKGDNEMTYGWSGAGIVDDVTYTGYLALGGSGSRDYRSLIVNVPAGCTLRFIAQSSGTSERTLKVDQNVVQEDGSVKSDVTKVTVPAYNNMTADSFTSHQVYIQDGGAVYLYSAGSGINIFAVEIVSGNKTVN